MCTAGSFFAASLELAFNKATQDVNEWPWRTKDDRSVTLPGVPDFTDALAKAAIRIAEALV